MTSLLFRNQGAGLSFALAAGDLHAVADLLLLGGCRCVHGSFLFQFVGLKSLLRLQLIHTGKSKSFHR